MSTSKLRFTTSSQLLRAYPVSILKDMLKDSDIQSVVNTVMSQNSMAHLVVGRLSDEADIKLQTQMAEEIRFHIQHIANTGFGTMDLGDNAPRIEDYSNFQNFLVELCHYIKSELPDSQLNNQWKFKAFLRESYPDELVLLKATTGLDERWFHESDRDEQNRTAGIIGKTTKTEEAQALISESVKSINDRHSYVADTVLDDAKTKAAYLPCDKAIIHKYPRYIAEVVRSLSTAVICKESVLCEVASQLHEATLVATSSLSCTMQVQHRSLSCLDAAVVGINVRKLSQIKRVLNKEAQEVARAEAERIEHEELAAAQRVKDEAEFSNVLAYEQRKLELGDKVRDGSITLDELTEYKQMQ
ncbi:hypothetical protein [Vibrio alginolyticus]